MAVYGNIGNYKKSIECCDFALNSFPDMSNNDKVTFMYNNALNYSHINNLELALKNITLAEKIVNTDDVSMYIKILNNKAVYLSKMKSYEEALGVFNQILSLINKSEVESYLINLINIANIYMDINKKDKVIEYLDIIIKRLSNLRNNRICVYNIYFDIGKIYKEFDKIGLSEDFYLKALDFSEKQKNYILANEILNSLIDMYTLTNSVEKMNDLKEKVFFIAIKKEKLDNLLMYKLIRFYDKLGSNSGTCAEIANFALKFN